MVVCRSRSEVLECWLFVDRCLNRRWLEVEEESQRGRDFMLVRPGVK